MERVLRRDQSQQKSNVTAQFFFLLTGLVPWKGMMVKLAKILPQPSTGTYLLFARRATASFISSRRSSLFPV
jgi:hypothetical protein